MFGALNRFISRLDSDPLHPSNSSQDPQSGFQVLRNTNPSLHIEPWYDFIIGINGRPIDNPSPHLLQLEISNCAASTLTLLIYSAKGATTRTLHIPPSPPSSPPSPSPALALTLQHSPLALTHEVWHILSTAAFSPAETAGLLPVSDYIIGTPTSALVRGESGLSELVEDHLERPLTLWVYNAEYDVTREVEIRPSRNWGGEGILGCTLGYGALHRLPRWMGEKGGEVMFESARAGSASAASTTTPATDLDNGWIKSARTGSVVSTMSLGSGSEILIPATHMKDLAPPISSSSAQGKKTTGEAGGKGQLGARGRRAAPAAAGAGVMDDYFREGEEKSRALDGPGSKVKGAPPPPPPPRRDAGLSSTEKVHLGVDAMSENHTQQSTETGESGQKDG